MAGSGPNLYSAPLTSAFRKFPYWAYSGWSKPRFCLTAAIASGDGFFPMYCAASWSVVSPAMRGSRKKIAKVTALTTSSSTAAARILRTM